MSDRLPIPGHSASEPAMPRASQHDLDHLVDGDLEPGERRRVLAALADEAGGWQRCALAFLEAQSWRKACRQLAAEPSNPPSPATFLSGPLWRRRDVRRLAAGIAAAAAVIGLVFCGGLATGRAWPTLPRPGQDSPSAATAIRDAAQGGPQAAVADGNGGDARDRKESRMLVHVLGFINVQGEDGARHSVPILAAPGLKLDAPQHVPRTLAACDRACGRSDEPGIGTPALTGLDGEAITGPLTAGQRVAIPADWMNAIAQSHSVY